MDWGNRVGLVGRLGGVLGCSGALRKHECFVTICPPPAFGPSTHGAPDTPVESRAPNVHSSNEKYDFLTKEFGNEGLLVFREWLR